MILFGCNGERVKKKKKKRENGKEIDKDKSNVDRRVLLIDGK